MLQISHQRVSAEADDPAQPQLVQPSDWNAVLNATMATARMLGRLTAGNGAVEELTGADVLAFAGAEASGAAAAAVAAHEAAIDPHPQYLTAAEGNAAYDASGAAVAEVAAHAAAADPHTGYQKESEKGAVNGYASLDAGGTVPDAQIPASITRDAEAVLDGDAAGGDLSGTYPNPTVTQARGLRETSGPTTLTLGAVADGEFLKRSGATVIGGTPTAALPDLVITKRSATANQTVTAGYSAIVAADYEIASGFVLELAANGLLEIA